MERVIRKTGSAREPSPLLSDYAAGRASFSWEGAAGDLKVSAGASLNLGALAAAGGGSLVWYGVGGEREHFPPAEVAERSARAAHALRGLGIGAGDRVAFLSRAIPEAAFGVLGALLAGAIPIVLGRTRNASALRNVLEVTRAAAAVVEPETKAVLDPLRPSLPTLKQAVILSRGGAPAPGPGEASWEDLWRDAPGRFEAPLLAPEAPAFIQFSEVGMSGSIAPHRAAFALASSAAHALDLRPGEGLLTVSIPGDPYFVPYGILAPLLRGAATLLIEDPVRFARFGALKDPVQVWYSSTRAIDVLLRTDPDLGRILANCRHIAVTYPYDPAFVEMTEVSYGSPLHATWAPREFAAIQCAELRACDLKIGSIGRPLPGVEMQADPETGRLAIRIGPGSPFAGYWEDPEQTARRVKKEWFISDHRGRIDADGYAWIAS